MVSDDESDPDRESTNVPMTFVNSSFIALVTVPDASTGRTSAKAVAQLSTYGAVTTLNPTTVG